MVWDFGVSKELELVDKEIQGSIRSEEPLLTDIASYVIGSGGKRIRPTVVLLSYKAVGGQDIKMIVEISAAFELIHNATLIHDDINDGGSMRRGKIPAHIKYGVHPALVTGDFLFVKGFALGGKFDSNVVEMTAGACSSLAEGEIRQKNNKWNIDLTLDEYFETIKRKTAMPIKAGAMAGAYIANGTMDDIESMGDYGLNLGMAFQITDDILDIAGDHADLGKETGSDIREGNITILCIHALNELKDSKRHELERILKKKDKSRTDIEEALGLIRSTSAVEKSREDAMGFSERAKKAIGCLPESKCKEEMLRLADYVITRNR